MPVSRGRKPKKYAVIHGTVAQPKAVGGPTPKGPRWGKIPAGLLTLFTLLTGAVGLTVLWPRVIIDATNAPEASNPFSGIFKVANAQFYPMHDVRIEAFLWCAKIGRSTDTAPPTKCERGMASSKREWNRRTLEGDDAYQISVGDVLFATPTALLYADISIKATFQPWVVPYHLAREFRFYTRRKDNGEIEWLHKPLD